MQYNLSPGSCVTPGSACVGGSYPDASTRTCTKCNDACVLCDGPSIAECSKCASGYWLLTDLSTCSDSCPAEYYERTQNTDEYECALCINNCLTCTDATTCITCHDTFYLKADNSC